MSERSTRLAGALKASGLRAHVEMRPDPTGHGAFARVRLEFGAMDDAARERAVTVVQALGAHLGLRVVLLDVAAPAPRVDRAPATVREARALLGLAPGYTARDVTLAWRALARTTHPDAGGSAEAFGHAQRAVEIARAHLAQRAGCAA